VAGKTPALQAALHTDQRIMAEPRRTLFAEITSKRIRRGSYTSVGDLEAAIYDYLGQHNAKPKPFTWTKTAEDILARERRALDKIYEIRGNR